MRLEYFLDEEFKSLLESKDSIFHYTTNKVALENILFNSKLRLSPFNSTNDPYEYKYKMFGVIGWGWDEECRSKLGELTYKANTLVRDSKVISFCQNEFDGDLISRSGFLKSRVWSQYGENHKGVCLVFSKEKILGLVEQLNCELKYFDKVEYKPFSSLDRSFNSLRVNKSDFESNEIANLVKSHINNNYSSLFFSKEVDYKDETEFRVVVVDEIAGSLYIDISTAITAIILGDNMHEIYFDAYQKLSDKYNIPCKKLHWESTRYHLINLK